MKGQRGFKVDETIEALKDIAKILEKECVRPMNEENTCGNCRFWQDHRTTFSDGRCRRFPEHVERDSIDWCGEWQEKTKNQEFAVGDMVSARPGSMETTNDTK